MVKVPLSNSFLERRDARRKFNESLGAGISLRAMHSSADPTLIRKWPEINRVKFRLRRRQSWKASPRSRPCTNGVALVGTSTHVTRSINPCCAFHRTRAFVASSAICDVLRVSRRPDEWTALRWRVSVWMILRQSSFWLCEREASPVLVKAWTDKVV